MKSEYVKLTGAERLFGQKNLLHTQLEFLNLIRSFRAYKLLRKEELILKVALKNSIADAMVLFERIKKTLPETHFKMKSGKKRKGKKKIDASLQDEIEDIQKKLTRLKVGM